MLFGRVQLTVNWVAEGEEATRLTGAVTVNSMINDVNTIVRDDCTVCIILMSA